MLPAHLAENIRQQVLYYLQSTFDFHDKGVERAFERLLEDPESSVFSIRFWTIAVVPGSRDRKALRPLSSIP